MKAILIILDGAAGLPHPALKNKTSLETAKTPNLDFLANQSEIDYCYPIKPGVAPQSHNAVLSLLGYNPNEIPRGPLEAQGFDIQLKKGDLALRTNFCTIDSIEKGNILDKRAGRTLTTKEAKKLAKTINQNVKLKYPFEFYPTVQHRGVLIFRGGFSDNISNADPFYGKGIAFRKEHAKIQFSKPLDDEDDSKLSADLLNTFIRKSHEVLNSHPINIARTKKGIFPANFLNCRDPGNSPIKLKKLKGKWLALGYMPLENGIAKATGMELYFPKSKPPKLKKTDVYQNLRASLKRAAKSAKKMLKKYRKKYDYFYIHFKETDIPGHDNLPHEKVKMLEFLDKKFFSFLKKFIKNNKLIVTCDHSTPCKLKAHSADPVPVLIYPEKNPKKNQRFTEFCARKGKKIMGRELLKENFF